MQVSKDFNGCSLAYKAANICSDSGPQPDPGPVAMFVLHHVYNIVSATPCMIAQSPIVENNASIHPITHIPGFSFPVLSGSTMLERPLTIYFNTILGFEPTVYPKLAFGLVKINSKWLFKYS